MRALIKRYLITGILVLIPGVVTLAVLVWLIQWVAGRLQFGILPTRLPEGFADLPPLLIQLLNRALQFGDLGASLLIVLLATLAAGAVAHNYAGRRLIRWGDELIKRLPLLGMVYNAIQQLIQAVFSWESKFSRVVLIEYPRPGLWMIGFVSRDSSEFFNRATGKTMWNVFVPTAPNPTSGFLVLAPKEQCRELDLKIEDAFSLIISGGIVDPGDGRERSGDGTPSGD